MSENAARAIEIAGRLAANAGRVVLGKPGQIEIVVAALVCRGHVLFEDVPGTAKTMLARALSSSPFFALSSSACRRAASTAACRSLAVASRFSRVP